MDKTRRQLLSKVHYYGKFARMQICVILFTICVKAGENNFAHQKITERDQFAKGSSIYHVDNFLGILTGPPSLYVVTSTK